jgi:NADPH:quinone reductase-like Zn-dependent oxidoreductase
MRGIAIDRFGGPETLTLRDDLPDPLVGPDTVLVRARAAHLSALADMVDSGRLRVTIAARFPLAEAAVAHRWSEEGRTRGKIVLTVP